MSTPSTTTNYSPQATNCNHNCVIFGATIHGDISSEADIIISGELSGDLNCPQKVVIDKTGIVTGNIVAKSIEVIGLVKGNIRVTTHIHILKNGVVNGHIITPKLILEEGAEFASISFGKN